MAAIIGGGAAGALAARTVLRRTNWRTVLISPESRPGRGVAYGAAGPWHVLNSRAAAMSVDSADPGHLLRWCHAQGLPAEPATFLPRARYGDYLADQFAAAAATAGDRLRRRLATATAVRPEPGGFLVTDDTGGTTRADHVILAVGNPASQRPAAVTDEAYRSVEFVADPWAVGALDAIPADQPVLLIGTGLTAVDVALTLTSGGRRTPVEAISRRGLLPRAHPELPPPAADFDLPASARLRPLLRRVRQEIAAGADWVAVIDVVRTRADSLWAGLDDDAQQRFLRHCQRMWEVHRHRMAPPIASRVGDLLRDGALRVRAGRLTSVEPHPDGGLTVRVEGEQPRRYGAVVSCTGPGSLPGAAGPLLGGMLRDGLLRTGPHGLGVDTDADGRVRDAHGRAQHGLWLVGPLRRGVLWEATAVPEIRGQVERLAGALLTPNLQMQ
ncbi:FAD/NAD(P)-binding protein [Actinoplanes sp. DH11]|uniref:FAD/NAD(P)-binding protein n=1 Tax=Actinoplanes sp. DH11 TaxID=2857011 RepID=UPI001E508E7D|nr:FAD/NAD(P)-binding protein [Actinoplanes sp. DH11]